MKKMLSTATNAMQRFHRDRRGIEALQAVMLLGLGAIILVALIKFGGDAWKSAKGAGDDVISDIDSGIE